MIYWAKLSCIADWLATSFIISVEKCSIYIKEATFMLTPYVCMHIPVYMPSAEDLVNFWVNTVTGSCSCRICVESEHCIASTCIASIAIQSTTAKVDWSAFAEACFWGLSAVLWILKCPLNASAAGWLYWQPLCWKCNHHITGWSYRLYIWHFECNAPHFEPIHPENCWAIL